MAIAAKRASRFDTPRNMKRLDDAREQAATLVSPAKGPFDDRSKARRDRSSVWHETASMSDAGTLTAFATNGGEMLHKRRGACLQKCVIGFVDRCRSIDITRSDEQASSTLEK
jgi:hypothetical protein